MNPSQIEQTCYIVVLVICVISAAHLLKGDWMALGRVCVEVDTTVTKKIATAVDGKCLCGSDIGFFYDEPLSSEYVGRSDLYLSCCPVVCKECGRMWKLVRVDHNTFKARLIDQIVQKGEKKT